MKRGMIAAVAMAGLMALAACGRAGSADRQVASLSTNDVGETTADSENATATTAPSDPNEAALQFAKCMREHGVDMPEPVVKDDGSGGGGVMIQVGGPGEDGQSMPDKSVMDAANQDCQHFLQGAA